MPTPEKVAAVDELKRELESSTATLFTGYIGLSVAQLQRLRNSLGTNAKFRVTKNTLTRIAIREAGLADELEDLIEGPSAIAFVRDDPVEAAKGLRDFARSNPALVIRGGVLEGRRMSPEEIERIADLESREVLLGRAAGVMKASMSKAAALFNAPMTKAVRTADALRDKWEREGGAAAAEPASHVESAAAGAEAEEAQSAATQSAATQSAATQPEESGIPESPEAES